MEKLIAKNIVKIVCVGGLAVSASVAQTEDFCQAATSHTGESQVATSNTIQPIGDYHYEMWADAGQNSATYYADGSFSCEFSGVNDYLCREGLFYGQNSGLSYKQLGHLYADFKLTDPMLSTYQNVTYSYIGVYGWSQDPLIEWYVVDTWKPSRPTWIGNSGCEGCGKIGSIEVDGATYDVYVDKVQRGSIEGDNTPFTQYFSVRRTKRNCGTIDITAHFEAWEQLGLPLGNSMYEAKVLGEAGQYPENGNASGSIDFSYAKVYDENHKPGPVVSENPTNPENPGLDAIKASLPMENSGTVAQVFDMQGRALGNLVFRSSNVVETLRNTYRAAGTYMVRQDGITKVYSVK